MTKEKVLAKATQPRTETEHLVRNNRNVPPENDKKRRRACRFSYRRIKIPGRAAAFMILYNIFASTLLEFNMNH